MGKLYAKTFTRNNGANYNVNVEYYDSANDVVEDLHKRTLKTGGWHKPHVNKEFTGCETIDEAYEIMRTGYSPVVETLNKEYKANAAKMAAEKRISFENNICGYAPVVPLAMLGVPNSMISMKMKPIKTKVLDVYYDMTCNCGVEWTEIIEAGKNILSVILDLEKQGYRINLYGVQTYSNSEDSDVLIVKIKDAKRPLDLKRMSFPLCHTGFFRLIGFDWYGKTPNSKYRSYYGHSIAQEMRNDELNRFVGKVLGDNAVFLAAQRIVERSANYQKDYIKGVLGNDKQS